MQAIPYAWGFINDAEERKAVFMSKFEKPALEIVSPVSLVRWHPSATTCCNGSKKLCITFRSEPSAQKKWNQKYSIWIDHLNEAKWPFYPYISTICWCLTTLSPNILFSGVPLAATCSTNM